MLIIFLALPTTESIWFYFFLLAIGAVLACCFYLLKKNKSNLSKKQCDEAQRVYKMLADNTLDVVWTSNKDMVINYVSPSVKKLSGYETNEIVGKKLLEFVAPNSKDIVNNAFQNILKTVGENTYISSHNNERFEFYLQKKNGGKTWVETMIITEKDENQNFVGIMGVSTDISFRKRAENSLRKSDIALKQAISDKKKFLSVLAHDLRNPFNNIQGYAELLTQEENMLSDEQKQDFLKQINKETAKGFQLLENLIIWSKMHSGTLKNIPVFVDLEDIIRENILLLNKKSKEKRIKINFESPEKYKGYIDSTIAGIVVKNILNNAIKFTKPDGNVTIELGEEERFSVITIADTGIGIPSSQLENMWDAATLGRNIGTVGEKGSGLGLVLTRDLLSYSRGFFTIDSKLNSGTIVRVFIPNESYQR